MDNNQNFTFNQIPKNPYGFGYGLLLILISGLLSIIVSPLVLLITKWLPFTQQWLTVLTYALIYIPLLIIARILWSNKTFGFSRVPFLIILATIIATPALLVITEALVTLIPMPEIIANFFAKMVQLNLPGFIAVAVLAPIIEELIFRGVVLQGFLKKYSPVKAIILSAVIFGIAHLNPWQFVAAFIIGTFIGWVYYNTRSIVPCILIHFLNNGISFYIGYKTNNINTTFSSLVGGGLNYALLIILALAICAACYFTLAKIFSKNKPEIHNIISNQ